MYVSLGFVSIGINLLHLTNAAAINAPNAISLSQELKNGPSAVQLVGIIPSLNTTSANATLTQDKQLFPLEGTPFTLLFNYFSDPIPLAAFHEAFTACMLRIINYINRYSHYPIPHNRFEYDDSDVHIAFIGNGGLQITWLDLFRLFQGLLGFVEEKEGNRRIMHWEILAREKGKVGFGLLWYYPPEKKGVASE